jgi:hypothetical protein
MIPFLSFLQSMHAKHRLVMALDISRMEGKELPRNVSGKNRFVGTECFVAHIIP